MTTTFQIVDPADTSIVWFDLNDSTGAANAEAGGVMTWFGLGGAFDLGTPERAFIRHEPGSKFGGLTAYQRDGFATMRWRQRIVGSNYDNLVAGVNYLQRLLAAGGVIAYAPTGATDTRYIEFEPSPAAALFDGKELALWHAAHRFETPEGVTIQLLRQPYLRGSELDPAENIVTNSTLLLNGTSQAPDDWAWDSTTNITNGAADAAADAFAFTIATSSTRNLEQTTATGTVGNSQAWTFSVWAKTDAGTNARLTAAIQPLTSAGSNNGSEATSTQTTLTTAWQRISVNITTPSSSTSKAKVSIRMGNSSATSRIVYIRFAQLEQGGLTLFRAGEQTVSNNPAATGGRTLVLYNPGDAPTEGVLTLTADSKTLKIRDVYTALRSSGGTPGSYLADYVNGRLYELCVDGIEGTDTTSTLYHVSGETATGNVMVTDSTSGTANMARRLRLELTDDLEVLRGREWHLWVRVLPAGTTDKHTLRLNYAVGASEDVGSARNDPVVVDYTDGGGAVWTDVNLGPIQVPRSSTELVLDLFSRCNAGSNALYWDVVMLAPVDERVGWVRFPDGSARTWTGDDLNGGGSSGFVYSTAFGVSSGRIVGTRYLLESLNNACGTPPNSGLTLPGGEHVAWFDVATSDARAQTVLYEVQAWNRTNSAVAAAKEFEVAGGTRRKIKLPFYLNGQKQVQLQVRRTSAGGTNQPTVSVHSISHRYIRGLGTGEQLVSDADAYTVEHRDAFGATLARLRCEGALPVVLPPGLSVLYLHVGDTPEGQTDRSISDITRAPVASVAFAPRYYA